ncbi:hypothetical protein GGP54_000198 [Salinibacter ruber]|uniref:Twin-arginine translocation signal domain-containing protein n=1 Tax=Salinibacter ruber TaxID=146919 RepID=A0A9X2ZA97_9BACT|nr:hypothetical protein [Salinibacter ruber]MCS4036220.1 hypothetical protein [Salinibacter ruber]
MPASSRRAFLKTSAALALGTALPAGGPASARAPDTARSGRAAAGSGPLYRISLAQWSLHRALFDGDLDPLDFARTAREAFDIGAVEYVNQFFMDRATDAQYLQTMKTRACRACSSCATGRAPSDTRTPRSERPPSKTTTSGSRPPPCSGATRFA